MRILVVEDDAILAEGTCESLSKAGYAVDLAETGTKANAMIEAGHYDMLLLDIGLPGMDGFEVLRRLRKHNSSIPVLIISARDDVDFRIYGLDLGADDFMLKPFVLAELHARTRALLRRHTLSERNTLACGKLVVDLGAQRASVAGEPIELSIREWDVLVYLLRNLGKVVRKEAIIETLCDWKTDISLNAVEVYISRLRSKLDAHGIQIRTVRGFGYLLEEPAP
ncbi:response regulator transcription factor [Methylobacillus sp. Pita2]|uniref:response regulator transcription factor n=1 Tax=Methylobacillus TaxID=404 RepID=UPI002853F1E8|nr:response regulator transcription factor [Methylobacillus flagellatus]MDR5171260.1 response regulator transcription factor [Methylobacillus flagellatus]